MKLIGFTLVIIGFMWIMAEITVGFIATSSTESMWHQKNLSESKTIPRSEANSALNSLALRLTNHSAEYRMRSGDWRTLFEVADDRVIRLPYPPQRGSLPLNPS